MKTKFDAYEELKKLGFVESVDEFGFEWLKKEYVKEIDVAWYGRQEQHFSIGVRFNPDHSVMTAAYSNDKFPPFKIKTHLNEKRGLNAIRDTAKNKGFEL